MQQRANSVIVELSEQKLLRAVYSERQLQEVLTDFWFNHFNVDARKGADRFMLTEYERDAIRPRVLGKFRDLLGATAKSPAMLFYLDNWMSADPNGPHRAGRRRTAASSRAVRRPHADACRRRGRAPRTRTRRKGLNENYGRELMELHTLGVDGGYTQKDVTEVARAFTGWTIDKPRTGRRLHVQRAHPRPGPEGGARPRHQGRRRRVGRRAGARHPGATSVDGDVHRDQAGAALRERHAAAGAGRSASAARFRDTDGDLREVMRTILTSPEFLSPDAYRAKVKTPFEFVVSALRATGADVQDARPLVREVQQLGMPLYMCQPPTGYKDTGDAWVNTGALVSRMNLALRLASGQVQRHDDGTRVDCGRCADRCSAATCRRYARDDRQGDRRAEDGGADARLAGVSAASECRSCQVCRSESHDVVPTRISEERRVRVRQPRLRALVHGAHRGRRVRPLEAADRDLPARRGRRPQRRRAARRGRLLPRAAEHRDSAAQRRRRRGDRSRRLLRLQPAAAAAQAAVGLAASWRSSTPADRPTARARTSTRRTTWRARRPA